jgi:hypothetical protein
MVDGPIDQVVQRANKGQLDWNDILS